MNTQQKHTLAVEAINLLFALQHIGASADTVAKASRRYYRRGVRHSYIVTATDTIEVLAYVKLHFPRFHSYTCIIEASRPQKSFRWPRPVSIVELLSFVADLHKFQPGLEIYSVSIVRDDGLPMVNWKQTRPFSNQRSLS